MRFKVAVVVSNLLLYVLNLTVDGCTSHVYCTYSYNDYCLWLSGSNVTSHVSMQHAISTVRPSRKPPQHRLSSTIEENPFELRFQIYHVLKPLATLQWKPCLQLQLFCHIYTRVTDERQTDRWTDNILWQQRNFAISCNVLLKIVAAYN